MQGGDRRLHLIGTRPPQLHRRIDHCEPLVDHLLVPASAVLIFQQHQIALFIHAGMASRVLQQHQRKQAHRLGFSWHQPVYDAYQPDSFLTELGTKQLPLCRGVSLVEHQIQDREYAAQPFGQELTWWYAIWDARSFDLALGSNQTLLDRRLGEQKRPSDLSGRQSADCAEGQRDPRLHRKGGMTAGEDQPETFVWDLRHVVSQALKPAQLLSLLGLDGS